MSDLEIMHSIDGTAIPFRADETFDIGSYHPGKGKTIKFFIKNNKQKVTANIEKIHVEEDNAVFEAANTIINPGDSVECTVRILANPDMTVDSFDLDQMPADNLHLKGKVSYQNFHSRFEK